MVRKNKSTPNPFRLLALSGFLALFTGTTLNILFGSDFPESIIPNTLIVTPVINGICTFLSFILIFLPENIPLMCSILLVECIYDVLTGFDMLGLFLFSFMNLILFCKGFFKTQPKKKAIILTGGWLLLLTTLLPFGLERFIFAIAVSFFMFCAYICIYHLLIDKLSYLLPDVAECTLKATYTLPEPGSRLNLQSLGLTDRQCGCIKAVITTTSSYREIGEKYFVSESAIKKEMSQIFRCFGVKNREMLRLLLMQYIITDW